MGTVDSDNSVECAAKTIKSPKNISSRGHHNESPRKNGNSLKKNSVLINESEENSQSEAAILVNGNRSLPDIDRNLDELPDDTPVVTPDEMRDDTPDDVPVETPDEMRDDTPSDVPVETPDERRDDAPDEMLVETQDGTRDDTPDEVQVETPDEMQNDTLRETPDDSLANECDSVAESATPLFQIKVLDDVIKNAEDLNNCEKCSAPEQAQDRNSNPTTIELRASHTQDIPTEKVEQDRDTLLPSMELESQNAQAEKVDTDEQDAEMVETGEQDAKMVYTDEQDAEMVEKDEQDTGRVDTDEQDAEEALTEFLKLNTKTREKRFLSEDISDSKDISNSKGVSGSMDISDSKDISNSKDVSGSMDISDSKSVSNKLSTKKSNEIIKTYPSRKSGKSKCDINEGLNNKLTKIVEDTASPRKSKIVRFEPRMTTERLLNLLESDEDDTTISAPVSLVVQVPKMGQSEIDKLCSNQNSEPTGMRTRKRKLKFSSNGKLIKRDKTRNLDKKFRSAGAKLLYSSDSEDDGTESPSESSDSEVDEPEKLSKTKPKLATTKPPPTPLPSKPNASKIGPQTPRPANNKVNNMRISTPPKTIVHPIQILCTVAGGLQLNSNHIRVVKFAPKIMEVRNQKAGIPAAKDKANVAITKSQASPISTPLATKEQIRSTFAKLPGSPQATAVSKSLPAAISSPMKVGSTLRPDGVFSSPGKCAKVYKCKPFSGPKNSYLQPIFDIEQDYAYERGSRPEKVAQTTPIVQVLHDIHKVMPNWNLHILPESETYCISNLSRGRLGMPTLSKSVELDENFSARVYVHQLHMKRFDGIYDTQDSLIKLIKEIDALPS